MNISICNLKSKIDLVINKLFNIEIQLSTALFSYLVLSVSETQWVKILALHIFSTSALLFLLSMTVGLGFIKVIKFIEDNIYEAINYYAKKERSK